MPSFTHGLLILDGRGRLVLASAAAKAALSLPAEAEGRDARAALAGAPALAAVAGRALGRPACAAPEVVQVREGGATRDLAVQWVPLPGESAGGVVVAFADVTTEGPPGDSDWRRAALTGIGRLTSHMAHELKNPLGALKLYALLLSRQLRDGQSRELADKIARAVDQLSTRVSELSAFSPTGAPELAPEPLVDVVEPCVAAIETDAATVGVELVRRYQAAPATVRVDARALRGAMLAFLRNGLEAMPSGGTLTVGVAGMESGEIELTVEDTGAGMTAKVRDRLFEPFFTTKADGIGLGLALARQAVEQHGGRVEVRSEPGAGTTVRVVLPGPRQAGDDGRGTDPGH